MSQTGLIHIYTGTGKGKTTAAVGLATRALGAGLKVCYTSFHKNVEKYGYHEVEMLKQMGATVLIFAKGHPHLDKSIKDETVKTEVYEGIEALKQVLRTNPPDMLVMDEILIAVRDNYLAEIDLLDFVNNKPKTTELVLTGRGATPNLIAIANYVSEVNMIKHPYTEGIASRKGIEF
ncbi:MAG: cob(I)yrinic acid a,c-diamide adenosyltransferase [Bacteroidales bacterium]|nr:cob(I)yrinic acid a,c-diamide adenosyltransferase [Bacteroidales bacterium]